MKNTTRTQFALLTAFAALVSFSSSTSATTIHGDFAGDTVTFVAVTESSTTDTGILYGTPTVSGDTLDFLPGVAPNPSDGFGANSSGADGDTTDGFLSFSVWADSGVGISSLHIEEGGDYSMSVLGPGLAQVKANLIVQSITITEVDGSPISPVVLSGFTGETFDLPGDPDSGIWENSLWFDLDAALASEGISFVTGASHLTVNVNNTLQALTLPGGLASIVKKDFVVSVDTVDVPEPASLLLMMAGMALATAYRRR